MRSRASSPSRRLLIASASFLLFIALSIGFSSATSAAEVVDVRVGLHPTFTRVVFELDSAAGYQLSKGTGSGSGEELVVILQASSIPRSVQAPRKSLLGLVRVSPDGRNSIARMELKQKGLVVKERIMSSPYRVVLDVIDPAAEAAAKAPPPKPKPAPKPVAQTPAPKPPEPAPTPPKPTPAAQPPPRPAPKAPAPAVEDDLLGGAAAEPAEPAAPERRIGQAPPVPAPDARPAGREPSEGGIATMGQADEVSPPKKPTSPPKARMADTGEDGFGSVLLIGGGVLLAVFALLYAMRMRARKNIETEASLEAEASPSNPFASLRGDDDDEPGPPPRAPASGGPQLTLDSLVDDMPTTGPGADDAAPSGGEDLAATTISARNVGDDDVPFALAQEEDDDGTAVPAIPLSDADDGDEEIGEEEMSRLIAQFEQRIASLESRLDEQAEARERLERQVAAQTEELRVQRAAIARTQRAVRNLTRGEEDGPTEPALRDPNG